MSSHMVRTSISPLAHPNRPIGEALLVDQLADPLVAGDPQDPFSVGLLVADPLADPQDPIADPFQAAWVAPES